MTSTTPLLLLLDSILSQEPDRIRQARARISETVEKAGITPNTFEERALPSPGAAANNIVQDVKILLSAFPNLASVPSSHDGSLPLHFAASIGNVQVAHLLLQAVS
jgi:ankyrin repeat protein